MILEWSSDPEKGAQLHADSLKKEKTKIWQSHLWTRMRKDWSSPGLLMRGGQFHSFWRLAVPSTPDCVHISCDPCTAAPGHTPKEMQTNVSWTQTQETGVGFIPGSGKSPGVESGDRLQYSRLENSMDRGAWWAIGEITYYSLPCLYFNSLFAWHILTINFTQFMPILPLTFTVKVFHIIKFRVFQCLPLISYVNTFKHRDYVKIFLVFSISLCIACRKHGIKAWGLPVLFLNYKMEKAYLTH